MPLRSQASCPACGQTGARWLFWGLVAAVLLLTLSPAPYLKPLESISFWDKAEHALSFAGLGLLGLLAYPPRSTWVLVGLLLLGGAIELVQAATGWRSGEWADWLADAIGLLPGLVARPWLVTRCSRA